LGPLGPSTRSSNPTSGQPTGAGCTGWAGSGRRGRSGIDWIGAGGEPEIQQLRLFTSRVTKGAGQALLLSGDLGVGKTSLLDLAAAITAGSGIRLLRTTGVQFEADI
jgi:predicted ATPase